MLTIPCEVVDHVCIFDDHQVEPAAAPLPSGGHSKLSPNRLELLTIILQIHSPKFPLSAQISTPVLPSEHSQVLLSPEEHDVCSDPLQPSIDIAAPSNIDNVIKRAMRKFIIICI